jgi:hypothetical protein
MWLRVAHLGLGIIGLLTCSKPYTIANLLRADAGPALGSYEGGGYERRQDEGR